LALANLDVRRRVAARAVGAIRRTSRAIRQVGRRTARPASGKPRSTRRMRRWQTLACSVTRVMAKRARDGAPCRRAGRGLLGRRAWPSRQGLQGIGGVGLRPGEPALGKYFAASGNVVSGGGVRRTASSNGPTTPSSPVQRLALPVEPGVEGGKACSILADLDNSRSARGWPPIAGNHVRPSPDVDPK
jgi:hypothetical protein